MSGKDLKGVHILVVDDEIDLREMIEDYLVVLGAEVSQAANGLEAFELIEKYKYDIILTDVRMPECSGIDLVNKIRTANITAPPIVMMSAFVNLSPNEINKLGVSAFILKPAAMPHILEILLEVLEDDDEEF